MAVITVPDGGATVSNVTFDDTLQAASDVNLLGSPLNYEVDGTSTLQSLVIGYDIDINIGFLNSGSLTGTGNITGPSDATVGNLPLLYNYGALDINGTIGVNFTNEGGVTVSDGELLAVDADLLSVGSSTVTVASGGELDINSPDPAIVTTIDVEGTLKLAAPLATITVLTNNGAIDLTSGKLTLDESLQGSGSITVQGGATLFLETTPAAPVTGTFVLGDGSTLQLSSPSAFHGTLQAVTGAQIDLMGVSATAATVANGAIAVSTSTGTVDLAETGLPNGTTLSLASDGQGGSLITIPTLSATAPGASTPGTDLPVYRFFDTTYGTHLFTQSLAEAQQILATRPDLTEETNNFGAVSQSAPDAEPVYRFFETTNGTHFFTASQAEFTALTTPGSSDYRPDLTYEASSTFYEDSTQQSGDVPVYRLFDTVHGTQFLTGSQSEYAGLTTPGSGTYRADLTPEGVAFYAPTGSYTT